MGGDGGGGQMDFTKFYYRGKAGLCANGMIVNMFIADESLIITVLPFPTVTDTHLVLG